MPRTTRLRRRGALAALVLALGPACSSGAPEAGSAPEQGEPVEPGEPVYPGSDWARADPADAGFDPATLDEIAAQAEANDSNCLVVTRHGQLVAEWYWNGTDAGSSQEVFSATKSVTSTLVGIAQADGALDSDDAASQYVPEWAGTPSADVTVENILSNDSGRHWDLVSDYHPLRLPVPAQRRVGRHPGGAGELGTDGDRPTVAGAQRRLRVPLVAQPPGAHGRPPAHHQPQDAAPDGQLAPGAPQDMYWARGLGGQVVQVDPGSDTVVVRLGGGDLTTTYGHADTAKVVTDALVEDR